MSEMVELPRDQVVALIGKHIKKLAELAQTHQFLSLHYFLQMAAKQADKDLQALQGTTS